MAKPERIALPVDAVLGRLTEALAETPAAVLAAPPGAGKTTRVPPALLAARWATGRILMLEPRRLAARAAAERMAAEMGEETGQTVGYRIRGEARVSRATRIEVVTEGILTRMLQADPELPGVSAVIFDEIHERSIHADLGLALAREVQEALRPDLRLVAMSATLDTARTADLLGGAPVIESEGRVFPVETRWLDTPWQGGRKGARFEAAMAGLVHRALAETEGDVLAFLPGAGEIGRVAGLLEGDVAVRPLHGSLPFERQRAALAPEPDGRRRVVLATAIAETSLTVEGVRVVVDGGRARRARTHPATGLSRLVTEPVSRAEAEQRRGRAGRVAPGVCYRLWTKGEEGALPAFAPPEILTADLAALALELAVWGVDDPSGMAFADPPPAGALAEARGLLAGLGALDAQGRITGHGRAMASFPAHPRLAHMMIVAESEGRGAEAALLAALLEERDPLRGTGADIATRIGAVIDPAKALRDHDLEPDRPAVERIRAEAKRLAGTRARAVTDPGGLLALAYPDRVGLRRKGEAPRYLLSGGRGAEMDAAEPMGAERLVVALDLEDQGRNARIRLAARIDEATLRKRHGDAITWRDEAWWERRTRRVEARQRETFGAIALDDRIWRDVPGDALGRALADGVRDLGLGMLDWPAGAASLRARVAWLRAQGGPLAERLPDLSDDALRARLDDWLTPHLSGLRTLEEIATVDLHAALRALLDWETAEAVDRAAPSRFRTPLGSEARIDYARAEPTLSIRVQELFGQADHPTVGDPPIPLVLELTSPAGRPVQTTRDLAGFWANSYADVRKEMRARYPKHPWPENPLAAEPTRRAKPKGR